MDSVIPIQKYLALNHGKYLRKELKLPQANSNVCLTIHPNMASTDLPHYHEKAHLSFILSGRAMDKRRNSETEKNSGELMFFHAGEIHQSIYKGFPVKNINVELEWDFFRQNRVTENDLYFSATQNPNTKLTMLRIYKELSNFDEYSFSSLEMLVLSLLESKTAFEKTRPVWIKKVVELLNDKWNEDLSLEDLSQAADIHPKTISKCFPKYFACTFGEYRRQIKIEKALSLIKTSSLSLTEIAYQCGFYDQSHFISVFKKLTGLKPKHFQKL